MVTTNTTMACRKCGEPLASASIWIDGQPYHYTCTPYIPALSPFKSQAALTEDDVRRIVREELAKEPPK